MGTSVAYHLALRGAKVLLLDKLGAAGGPSGASAGILRAHYEDPAIVAVAHYGCDFLADMLARTGSDPGFVNCGYLAVGEADREPRIRTAIEAMRSQGVVVEELDNAQIRALEPRLAAGALTIGAYEPTHGVCEPLFVADGFARAAERLGARLSFGARVTAVRPDGEGFLLLCADGRRISAERVAVCCGGFGPRLTRSLGGSLPGRPRARPGRALPPAVPVRAARPDRLAPHARGLAAARRRRRALPRRRPRRLPRPRPVSRALGAGRGGPARAGAPRPISSRPSSPARPAASSAARGRAGSTSRPTAIPWSTSCRAGPGLLLASGMSGHAFKLCPALGLGASELLLDGEVRSFDWSPFRYGRFDRRHAAAARGAGGTGTG